METVADPIPTQRAGNFVVNVGDEMWVLGGESASQTHAHQEVEALKVNAHTWRSLPNMNQGRHGTGAIVYENKVFVASGCGNRGGQPELTQMEAFLPAGVSLVPFYDYTPSTTVSIDGEKFFINDKPTYEGREWNGHPVEGLLMNSRMVQGIFDDTNRETRGNWRYPDGGWNPYRNTREFVAAMPAWREHGLLSFTLNMQGGSPMGYGNKDWINTPYDSLGNLDYSYMMRLEQILKKADELEMVVILGLFYFGQDEELKDEKAIYAAIDNTIDWLMQRQYRNVIIEVNNECDVSKYDHEILKPGRVAELIKHIKAKEVNGFRFLTGTSFGGGSIPTPEIAKASDFILIHGNGVKEPSRITEMVQQTREILAEDKKPILFNEDDHYNFEKEENNFAAAVKAYASWGYFDFRREGEEFEEGYQSMPADWGIGSDRKKAFFEMVKLVTGS